MPFDSRDQNRNKTKMTTSIPLKSEWIITKKWIVYLKCVIFGMKITIKKIMERNPHNIENAIIKEVKTPVI